MIHFVAVVFVLAFLAGFVSALWPAVEFARGKRLMLWIRDGRPVRIDIYGNVVEELVPSGRG